MLGLTIELYEIVGKIVFYIFLFIILLVIIGLIQFIVSIRTKKFIFPSFQSFLIDTFHPIFKTLFEMVGLRPHIIDEMDVELKNLINEEKFAKTPMDRRIVVLPQCLRSISCPAKLSSERGIECLSCGKCKIKEFKKEAEELQYRLFIVPGGTFVGRILKKEKPEAVIGVGCFADLVEGIKAAQSTGVPVQGVLLGSIGCVETIVDWIDLREKLHLGYKTQ
ncbi:MAG: DUF116 domain-containing protein [Candidatus Methanofastidiosia archaeon]